MPKKRARPVFDPASRLAYTIDEFCVAARIDPSTYYRAKKRGERMPQEFELLGRRLISVDEAERWIRERTQAAASPEPAKPTSGAPS